MRGEELKKIMYMYTYIMLYYIILIIYTCIYIGYRRSRIRRRTVVSSLWITRITGFFFIFSVTTTFPPAAGCRVRDNVIASKSRCVLLSGFCVRADTYIHIIFVYIVPILRYPRLGYPMILYSSSVFKFFFS